MGRGSVSHEVKGESNRREGEGGRNGGADASILRGWDRSGGTVFRLWDGRAPKKKRDNEEREKMRKAGVGWIVPQRRKTERRKRCVIHTVEK